MSFRLWVATFVMLLSSLPALAQHPFSVNPISGTASIASAVQTGTEWDVLINAGGSPGGIFSFTTNGVDVEIDSLVVNVTSGTVLMILNEAGGGNFEFIANISGATSGTEELQVGTVQVSGTIGRPGGTGSVIAEVVNTLIAGEDLTATVIAGPRAALGATTSVVQLIDVDGDVTGSILAHYGYIDTISVAGALGTRSILLA